MAFRPKKFDSGKVLSLPATATTTFTKGKLVKMSAGYLAAAATGDNEVEYLCLQTVTSGATDGATLVDVLPIDDTTVFEALTDNTPVQATNVGNDYDLTDDASLDLDNTTDKVFHIDRIIDASSKLVEGRFNKPAIA